MKMGFVILHYLALEETVNCVKSIMENVEYKDKVLIVVNNGVRQKEDLDRLRSLEDQMQIFLVNAPENLGYARGINLGFAYAKKQLACDFIIAMNNDILIKQHDFCNIILRAYEETAFAAAGPKILLADGIHDSYCNPKPSSDFQMKKVYFWVALNYTEYLASYLHLDGALGRMMARIRAGRQKRKTNMLETKKSENVEQYITDCQLYGCCFVFSPIYVQEFDGLVDQKSLYLEEEILSVQLMKKNMKAVYVPELELIHLENVSTDIITKTDRKKAKFVYRNHIQLFKVLVKEARGLRKNA